jgi:hypothetical protein
LLFSRERFFLLHEAESERGAVSYRRAFGGRVRVSATESTMVRAMCVARGS